MWRTPDREDLEATLSAAEAAAFTRRPDGGSAWRRLLERTCELARDALRSNGRVRLSPEPHALPGGCVSKAMDYLAYDVLKRLDLPLSEARAEARRAAEEYFAKVAAGQVTPESYGSDGTGATGGPAIEVVAEARPRVTAAKLEGL